MKDIGNTQRGICLISRKPTSTKNNDGDKEDRTHIQAVNLRLKGSCRRNKIRNIFIEFLETVKLCFLIQPNDTLLLQYPTTRCFDSLCNIAHRRNAKVVALAHWIESLGGKEGAIQKEIKRLANADYVIASNSTMQEWLKERKLGRPIGALQLHDYLTLRSPDLTQRTPFEGTRKLKVVYVQTTDRMQNKFVTKLPKIITQFELDIYGDTTDTECMEENKNITFKPHVKAGEFIAHADADFALVWKGKDTDTCSGESGTYLRYGSPHEVSLYLRAGLPVIIWKEAALADLIEQEGAGIAIDSIEGLNEIMKGVTPLTYKELQGNAMRIGKKIANGYYFSHAWNKALECLDKPEGENK